MSEARPKSPRRSKRKTRRHPAVRILITSLKVFTVLGLILLCVGLGAGYVVYQKVSADLPDVAGLANYEAAQTSRIFSHDGQVVATMFQENRTMESLDHISKNLVSALIAVEDSRFYEHHGVDWVGVARAVVANALHRGIDQGASTLTMQLARGRFLTQARTADRKLKEVVLALRIEGKYPKDKILEYYLNHVYFGSGAYGVAAASSIYFNRRSADLSLPQAAMIAGLVQAPSELSPLVNPKGAIKRMKIVLQRMRDLKMIDDAKYKKAVEEGERLRFGGPGGSNAATAADQLLKYPYFTTYVIAELAKRYPEDMLYRGGLRISTTLDIGLQKICEDGLQSTIDEMGGAANAHNGACVLIDNKTGAVRAMVGGTRWSTKNQFNRAWQALRQPGSSFKPFVYATALSTGMTPETIVPDRAITLGTWSPKNSDGRFMGDIPLRTGLQFSRNPVSAQLINTVGPDQVVSMAQAMGIQEKLEANPSLALGSCEVSVLSMAQAYATIACGGLRRDPTVVSTVMSPTGELLTDNRSNIGRHALDAGVAALLNEMMIRVVQRGTGTAASLGDIPVAGKTGTTDDSRDAWFVGFTPDYTLAVWIGNDDHSAMYNVFGGGIPAIAWHRIMAKVGPGAADFPNFRGKEIKKLELCAETTALAAKGCPHKYTETFRCGVLPTVPCPKHEAATPTPTATPGEEVEVDPDAAPPPLETETPAPDAIPEPTTTPVPEETPEAIVTPQEDEVLMLLWGCYSLAAWLLSLGGLVLANAPFFLCRVLSTLMLMPGLIVLGSVHGGVAGLNPLAVYTLSALCTLAVGWATLFLLQWRPRRSQEPISDGALTRRSFLAASAGVGAGAVWLRQGYHNRTAIELTQLEVPIRQLPPQLDGLRVAMMADWHCGPHNTQDYLSDVVRRCNETRPDIILIPGDFLSYSNAYAARAAELIERLKPRIPDAIFASYGNHDYWSGMPALPPALKQAGARVLTNQSLLLTAGREVREGGGKGLYIVGLDDLWGGDPILADGLKGIPADQPRLVLCHNPDVAEIQAEGRVDLMVSGHTHGGQVSFPCVGPLIVPSNFGQKYASGLVQGPAYPVYVTRGVGVGGLPVRIGVSPELCLFTLKAT